MFCIMKNQPKNKWIPLALALVILAAAQSQMTAQAEQPVPEGMTVQNNTLEKRQYKIAQDGTGDFRTIQEGVDNASDGDTLVVYPGIYTEAVQVMGKEVHIIGLNKDLCIIQYDAASYRKSPLTVGAGRIANLTIYGMDSGVGQPVLTQEEIAAINAEIVGDSWERQKNYKGYAVHVDQNFLYGRRVTFENCRVISENNHCAGIGTRGDSTVSFENCEFISLGGGSCIFLHDPTSVDVSGKAALVMKGCQMTSYLCPYVMTFQSLLPEYNQLELTFQNTRVSAVEFADDGSYVAMDVNSSFDVETLSMLEETGALYAAGLSSSAPKLVHKMTNEEISMYMEAMEKTVEAGSVPQALMPQLAEGITRIGYHETEETKETKEQERLAPSLLKHHVIAIYNRSNLAGNGWCGLDNAVLTADSYGNTLVEMNTVTTPSRMDGTAAWYSSSFSVGS
ncbi:hypothetical protein C804_06058 [Lachnospiraceae bacterium A4]|nr:hypothetical protein C804_06058 [Lachnospiraceae bacterium A4]